MEDNNYSISHVMMVSRVKTRARRLATDLADFTSKFNEISLRAEGMLNKELDECELDVMQVKNLLLDFYKELDELNKNVETEYSLAFEDLIKTQ